MNRSSRSSGWSRILLLCGAVSAVLSLADLFRSRSHVAALPQGLYFVGQVVEIDEAVGEPPDQDGANPRIVTFALAANPNRPVLQFAMTMRRSYSTGIVTGDVLRFDASAGVAADQAAFEAAVPTGEHVLANGH